MRPALRAFLFDLGGTLIRPRADWPPIWDQADRALVRVLASQAWIADEAGFLTRWQAVRTRYYQQRKEDDREYSYRHLLQELLPQAPAWLIDQALAAFFSITQPNWQAVEGAAEVLRSLQERGFRLGLLSNAAEDSDVQHLVDRMEFRPFFDFVLTSAACGYRKPHPLPYQLALQRWGFPPQEVAMVGDLLEVDILGAHRVGMFTIWIPHSMTEAAQPLSIRPDWILEHLAQLLEKLSA
ncbi:MAG: HAD family hydrolase [Chloroflexi bacterium]|nr:HAD family hydrolase [Chloroflexota bacterium]